MIWAPILFARGSYTTQYLSLPKIPSARAWQHERESAHPPSRCGPCFTCSLLLSLTASSHGAGLRSRTYICSISSISRCGGSVGSGCAALIGLYNLDDTALAQPAQLVARGRQHTPQVPFSEDQHMSRHSRRSMPMSRSTYAFCQGDLGDMGRSR